MTRERNTWTSTLILPAYGTALSSILLLLHVLITSNLVYGFLHKHFPSRFSETLEADDLDAPSNDTSSFLLDVQHHVYRQGGVVIFAYKTVRFLSVLALLGFSIATFILEEEGVITTSGKLGKKLKSIRPNSNSHDLSTAEWLQVAMIFTYVLINPSCHGIQLKQARIIDLHLAARIFLHHTAQTAQHACITPFSFSITRYLGCVRLSRPLASRDLYSAAGRHQRRLDPLGQSHPSDTGCCCGANFHSSNIHTCICDGW
jgi:hypothetical protein